MCGWRQVLFTFLKRRLSWCSYRLITEQPPVPGTALPVLRFVFVLRFERAFV